MPKYLALVCQNKDRIDTEKVIRSSHVDARDWVVAEWEMPEAGEGEATWIEGEIWDTWEPGGGKRDALTQQFTNGEMSEEVIRYPSEE